MYTLLLPALGNLLFLALHITGSGSFPRPLSAREEQECLQKIQQGDTAAKNKLIEHNLRLVAHIIKKYYAVSSDQDDLISIGTIGLIKAVTTFNAGYSVRLSVPDPMPLCHRTVRTGKTPVKAGGQFQGCLSPL